jgi:hypothetical protein
MAVDINDYIYNVETEYKSYREYFPLQWTTTPPTEEGLYFAYSQEDGVEIVHYRGRNQLDMAVMGIEWRYSLGGYTHWLGPLPVPEPPKVDA